MRHDTLAYKIISTAGQLGIRAVESVLSVFIREKGNVIDAENYPWTKTVEQNTALILKELETILADYNAIPHFDELSPEQKRIITGQQRWRTYMLYMYGASIDQNIKQCPETDRTVRAIPGMVTAFFSIIEPHTRITPHRGPYKGLLRYHLGLIVPQPNELCGIKIGSDTHHWQVGKSLIFDDTVTHEAWNDSDQIRVVLFVDFKRSYPFPINVFNNLMIALIRRSPFIADIVEKVEKGK